MKLNQFITAFTLIVLLALLICIVYARATWEYEAPSSPAPTQTIPVEEPVEPEQSEAPEPSEEPIYYVMYFTEDDVAEVAKMLWGEARGCTRDNQIKCVWVVLNRVDDERFPNTIQGVLEQPSQFHGYDPTYPVTDELYSVAFDVLTRWSYERQGIPVRRELPKSFLWFTGDGVQNHFRGGILKMSEYIDWDMVFIVGDETYLEHSVVQTATINISAAYGQENIFREVY